ncbi:hypothetical protein BJ138DRAFT_1083638 [Hygrophoropsis aurantiaca]|uniref:Uncharacterized protein n=1 Tax=Hygrophoropsis aurantiaca TaxID=72124 RepID=A0ACB8AGL7_9AGAM|nr:hypothetical protein BJ138DRAFT_1083638 [Hygrophoropsis aurantiaca]
MLRFLTAFGVLQLAIAGGLYLNLRPILIASGWGRTFESLGNKQCTTVPELKACEKVVLHHPSGVLYLACSTQISRTYWTPALDRLDSSGMSTEDYVATYNPKTKKVQRMTLSGFNSSRGINVHGMDVVASSSDPSTLYVYLVNHRKPLIGDSRKVGADSAIEVFRTQLGSDVLTHLQTFEDPSVIITPNDIAGSSDGKSFHVTNDHSLKAGWRRHLNTLLQPSDTSVAYCHADHGCKFAVKGLHASNGIVKGRGANETFYVVDCTLGDISVLERQSDDTLVLTEVIKTGTASDNLSIDENGVLWVAGLSDGVGMVTKQMNDPTVKIASSALRITINEGPGAFYGDKYKVDKVFEDPGELASGTTSATYDARRNRLYMHGLISPHLTVCQL